MAQTDNNLTSIYFAERILGALEALLATSLERSVFPHRSEFHINIEVSETVQGHAQYSFDDSRGGELTIKCPSTRYEDLDVSWMQELVIQIIPRIVMIEDLPSYGQKVFGEEDGFARALNFSDPSIPISNLLGHDPKFRVSDWKIPNSEAIFPLKRSVRWNHGLDMESPNKAERKDLQPGEGKPPRWLADRSQIKHTDQKVFSVIDIPLWDRAGWRAVMYLVPVEIDKPPMIALAFEDATAGEAIFDSWRSKLGRTDKDEALSVSIITGVDKNLPYRYKVVIGTDLNALARSRESHFVMVSRINDMRPTDSRNLDRFVTRFEKVKHYFLLPAHFPHTAAAPTVLFDRHIGKQKLRISQAWQIGINDPATVAIRPEDDPIIPAGVKDAPVINLLRKKRSERE